MSAITMSPEAVTSRIEEDYDSGAPYQWAVEWLRNVWVKPDTTVAYIRTRELEGHARLLLVDDGPAMTASEMTQYMATLGSGGSDIWRLNYREGDRHAGLRASLLPWTDVTVISWDATSNPTGSEMEIFLDRERDLYDASPVVQADASSLALMIDVLPSGATHGVMFILTGRDHADGPFYDSAKNETATGVLDALRDKVYEAINQGDLTTLDIAAEAILEAGAGAESLGGGRIIKLNDGRTVRLDGRKIKGLTPWTDRATASSGSVPLTIDENGTKLHWWLLPEVDEDRRKAFGGKGFIKVLYKNEIMDLGDERKTTMRRFGMIHSSVYDRVGILIIPPITGPGWHVKQNGSRSRLEAQNGFDLPVHDWASKFVDFLPEEISKANLQARGEGTPSGLHRVKRAYERISDRLRAASPTRRAKDGTGIIGLVADPHGEPTGSAEDGDVLPIVDVDGVGETEGAVDNGGGGGDNGGGDGGGGGGTAGVGTPTGEDSRRRKRTPARERQAEVRGKVISSLPEMVTRTASEWDDLGLDPDHFLYWDRGSGVIYMNTAHTILMRQINHYTGPWLDLHPNTARRATGAEIVGVLQECYHIDAATRIASFIAETDEHTAERRLTSEVLTTASYGYEAIDKMIEPILGGLGSTMRAPVVA